MLFNACLIFGACSLVALALLAQAQQYNAYDSDSNSDSDESPILANGELGKLVLNSARGQRNNNNNQEFNQLGAAATRNLYNRQQALQYAPTHNRRNYGLPASELGGGGGFGPALGASATGGRAYASQGDEDSAAFGPTSFNSNSNSNDDDDDGGDGEGSAADGQPLNLNQAASGYPGQADYSNAGAGFNFGGASGYGPSAEGSEFGSADGFGNDGRRYKSASTLSGAGNFAGAEDDVAAGVLQYGPNSAINAGGEGGSDDEARSSYSPEGQSDDNDDD